MKPLRLILSIPTFDLILIVSGLSIECDGFLNVLKAQQIHKQIRLFSSPRITTPSRPNIPASIFDRRVGSLYQSTTSSTDDDSMSTDGPDKDIITNLDNASINVINRDKEMFASAEFARAPVSSSSQVSDTIKDAQELMRRAKQLKAEALLAESELTEQKDKLKSQNNIDADTTINTLLTLLSTSSENVGNIEVFTDYLRDHPTSYIKMEKIVNRIYERELIARGDHDVIQSNNQQKKKNKQFMIGDVQNAAVYENSEEAQRLALLTDYIIASQEMLDKERIQKREVSIRASPGKDISDQLQTTLSNVTSTTTGEYGYISMAPALRSLLKEIRRSEMEAFQQRLSTQLVARENAPVSAREGGVDAFIRNTFNYTSISGNSNMITESADKTFNMSKIMVEMISQPMWVPSSMLGHIVACRDEISKEDLSNFHTDILQNSKFFCTSWKSTSIAAIYRGNIKSGSELLDTWNDINEQLELYEIDNNSDGGNNKSRLKDRIQLFLLYDPEWRASIDERDIEPKPVIFVTGARVKPIQKEEENTVVTKAVLVLSTLFTVLSTLAYATVSYALNPIFFNSIMNENNIFSFVLVLPIFFGVIALHVTHELAHIITAKRSHLAVGLPIPLPSIQIGTFGAITPLRSFPSSRTQLFDFALSGPVTTLFLSLCLSVTGIFLTAYSPADMLPTFPAVPVALLKSSFLSGSLVSVLAPKLMTLPLSQTVPIHPLFVVGFTGLISSSLNLLPIGRLDGGRVAFALFGRKSAYPLSLVTLLFLAVASLTGASQISIFWGILVNLFQRQPEIQVKDEITEVEGSGNNRGGWRLGIYTSAMLLVGLILAPFPGGLPL